MPSYLDNLITKYGIESKKDSKEEETKKEDTNSFKKKTPEPNPNISNKYTSVSTLMNDSKKSPEKKDVSTKDSSNFNYENKKDSVTTDENPSKEKDLVTTAENLSKEKDLVTTAENLSKEKDSVTTAENPSKEKDSVTTDENLSKEKDSVTTAENLSKEKDSVTTAENLSKEKDSVTTDENLSKEKDSVTTDKNPSKEKDSVTTAENPSKEKDLVTTRKDPKKEIVDKIKNKYKNKINSNNSNNQITKDEKDSVTTKKDYKDDSKKSYPELKSKLSSLKDRINVQSENKKNSQTEISKKENPSLESKDEFKNIDSLSDKVFSKKEQEEYKKEQEQKEKEPINIDDGHLIKEVNNAKIYRLNTQTLLHYKVPIPKTNPNQRLIINTLKEATTRLISTDPYKIRDPLQRENIYYQKIIDILENSPEINIPKHMYDFYAKSVVKEMVGYGLLEPLLHDEKLEEIMVVGPKKPVYVYHVDYGMMTTNIVFYKDESIQEIIDKIARTISRRVDISNPLLDARLPDGSRVNATIPPASIDGATLTIRKFKADPLTIVDLINFKTLNSEVGGFLWSVVEGFNTKPANILISGGTGSGKTTLLNVLANFIPERDRILTIEDTAELRLPIKHVIRFEGKPPGLEGQGELTLEILTKNTLRMRPDRIIVGEIRHKEAASLFTAMNTGHDGCMGTIHANSPKETLVRITSPPMNVPELMLAGIDFIVIQKRLYTSKGQVRRITSIAEVLGAIDGDPRINVVYEWDPKEDKLKRTENHIHFFDVIKSFTGLEKDQILKQIERKKEVLNTLKKQNIRELKEVSHNIQKLYISEKTNNK